MRDPESWIRHDEGEDIQHVAFLELKMAYILEVQLDVLENPPPDIEAAKAEMRRLIAEYRAEYGKDQ